MAAPKPRSRPKALHRVNTRIFAHQDAFIKAAAKKARLTEGEVHRALLEAAIVARAAND